MVDQDAISNKQHLLATYRRNLQHLLSQAAQYGGESATPIHIINSIRDTRENIQQIKNFLRQNSIDVVDLPDDTPPRSIHTTATPTKYRTKFPHLSIINTIMAVITTIIALVIVFMIYSFIKSTPRVTLGNWSSSIGDLELRITKVEVIKQIDNGKILRFYVTIDNQTKDSLSLPLFKNFTATDSRGGSYESAHWESNWPSNFPPKMKVTGSIDLKDPIPNDETIMNVSFSTIYGSLDLVGKSITVPDISIP